MIARSGTYIGNTVDPENSNEAQNSSPRFLTSSRVQEPAMKGVHSAINHSNSTTPASVIATRLHFHLRFRQSGPGYSRGKKSDKEGHQK